MLTKPRTASVARISAIRRAGAGVLDRASSFGSSEPLPGQPRLRVAAGGRGRTVPLRCALRFTIGGRGTTLRLRVPRPSLGPGRGATGRAKRRSCVPRTTCGAVPRKGVTCTPSMPPTPLDPPAAHRSTTLHLDRPSTNAHSTTSDPPPSLPALDAPGSDECTRSP